MNDIVHSAQEYLTVANGNGRRKILDIDSLLKTHPLQEVIDFLKTYLKEKQAFLRDCILTDKAKREIDETVAVMFRVTMAIKALEDGKEVSR